MKKKKMWPTVLALPDLADTAERGGRWGARKVKLKAASLVFPTPFWLAQGTASLSKTCFKGRGCGWEWNLPLSIFHDLVQPRHKFGQ